MAGRKKEVSDEEILQQFVLTPDPVLHSTEIAEELEMSRQGVHKRLQELEENGYLRSKKVASARIWWLTHAGHEAAAAGDS